ncbi:MAG: sugar ABC transporter ATP-binding protein [Candidatus Caldatribacteriota bacterium]|nr:sugar ABC transporter ATP-binding protein [Candidatus Caldatribacteriota bacterium]
MNKIALEFINISKSFPGVKALKKVSIKIKQAKVHAIVGENGAGKSTLMKIAVGELLRDTGTIKVFDREAQINSPSDGYHYGISLIHQEFSLVPTLDVVQNIFLGREITKGPLSFLDSNQMYKRTEEILDFLKMFHLDPHLKIEDLTIAQKQVVEIAKALSLNSKIIIMDEPSAALTLEETHRLFEVVRELKSRGVTTLFISHRIEEIFEIADEVSILRDGELILTKQVAQIDRKQVINNMVGRSLEFVFPPKAKQKKEAKVILEVKKITKERQFSDISFQLKEGEIIGLAGLVGSGRSEVALSLFGLNHLDKGEIFLQGKTVKINSPFEAIRNGLALLPEDRRELGLVIVRNVLENLTLPDLYWDIARKYFIDLKKEISLAKGVQKELAIRFASLSQKVESLSGGNQQKVVVGKWLLTKPKILIMDEPTRGIDVGAKLEIYNIVNTLAKKGIGIIFISSEFSEILGVAHRILVMSEGRITKELDPKSTKEEDILKFATRKKVS